MAVFISEDVNFDKKLSYCWHIPSPKWPILCRVGR